MISDSSMIPQTGAKKKIGQSLKRNLIHYGSWFGHVTVAALDLRHGSISFRFWPAAATEAVKIMTHQIYGRLDGKIALITGAAQGLGLAMSRMFVAQGARVVMTDINAPKLRAAAALLGAAAFPITHDVTSAEQWQQTCADAVAHFGGLNILVNNAGIGALGNVEVCTLEDWRRVHAIDLDGVFLGCKYALSHMAKYTAASKTRGAILNISSIAGVIAAPDYAAYNSAKAAVKHLSKSVALHCAKSGYPITCNSIHPVFIDTPILDGLGAGHDRATVLAKLGRQIPLGKVGDPDDVAYGAVYLCSDESKFVTGSALYIDGGISAQ
jgi:NAD(P)-dependent dehydrogenase (short-subunit alcohol dehydrogenase family)